ncbi:MAG: multifunctional CCA tRNA nucleotidyl transferase/2'3'-cyclic phosphodiesterase/2'nucleotidase/phosphatase [Burkholderiaceae bacterium]
MKAYVVGGAVRDGLLGLPVNDRDWVVVGATPQMLIAQGYRPVGRDFPVFLHPVTHEEVALARTERKSGAGYHGFVFHAAPEVTLEQDLARRDLTINAMALDPDSGQIIDPHGGQRDLRERVLRHVSDAFAEDPVRLLRLARFAARWPDFAVAPETAALLRRLVESGEVDALVPERVWQEVSRGLMEIAPVRMFDVLADCGALARLAPALGARLSAPTRAALDAAAATKRPLPERFALCCHESALDDAAAVSRAAAVCERWRVPADCRELALLLAREGPALGIAAADGAAAWLTLLERSDALRRPERFGALLQAWLLLAPAGNEAARSAQCTRWRDALAAASAVTATTLRAAEPDVPAEGPALGRALHRARRDAIERVLGVA